MTPEQQAEFLALVPTALLYEVFKTRFDHCIIAGLTRRPIEDDPDHYLVSYTYAGAPLFCIGLTTLIANKCQKDIDTGLDYLNLDEL